MIGFVFAVIMLTGMQALATERFEFKSYKDIHTLFKNLGYTTETWNAGLREIPRVYLQSVPSRWRDKNSKEVEVSMKKELFFRLLAPLVLRANESIIEDRIRLLSLLKGKVSDNDRIWLEKLALRYKVVDTDEAALTPEQIRELKMRVNAIPPSLAMAQAAEESGWGTSRFADLGNAMFGQWAWDDDNGITPEKQRKGKGDYKIAAFDTIQESVDGYMRNLNTHPAYDKLRQRRAELQRQNKPVTGLVLAETLDRYSERGDAYVKSLKELIKYNKLDQVDVISFSNRLEIILVPVGKGSS